MRIDRDMGGGGAEQRSLCHLHVPQLCYLHGRRQFSKWLPTIKTVRMPCRMGCDSMVAMYGAIDEYPCLFRYHEVQGFKMQRPSGPASKALVYKLKKTTPPFVPPRRTREAKQDPIYNLRECICLHSLHFYALRWILGGRKFQRYPGLRPICKSKLCLPLAHSERIYHYNNIITDILFSRSLKPSSVYITHPTLNAYK